MSDHRTAKENMDILEKLGTAALAGIVIGLLLPTHGADMDVPVDFFVGAAHNSGILEEDKCDQS